MEAAASREVDFECLMHRCKSFEVYEEDRSACRWLGNVW